MTRREHIERVLENYDRNDLLSLVGSINAWDGSLEDQNWMPLDMEEIWQCYVGSSGNFEDFVRAAANRDFYPGDDYWRWTAWGGIESTDEPSFDLDEIADWIEDRDEQELEREIGSYFAQDFAFDRTQNEPEEEEDPFNDGRMTEAEIAEAVGVYARNQTEDQKAELARRASEAGQRMLDPIDVLEFIAEHYPTALD